eukprot:3211096-Amphidinium_carterae.1
MRGPTLKPREPWRMSPWCPSLIFVGLSCSCVKGSTSGVLVQEKQPRHRNKPSGCQWCALGTSSVSTEPE